MTAQAKLDEPGIAQAFAEMPFDQFGRYHMLREAVDACRVALGVARLSVLDVGGYYERDGVPTLPIMSFLPADQITVLDIVACDLPGYVQGDGTALHFNDSSFDLVVSLDTLEHIPAERRARFWDELLRVARHGVLLLAPFATPEVEAAETLLFAFIQTMLHAEHQQLKEHRVYGLPVLGDWLRFLGQRGLVTQTYPTGFVHGWLGMMLIKHLWLRIAPGAEAQRLIDGYYNRFCFPTERRQPAYRYLIVAEKTPGLVAAVDRALRPTLLPDLDDPAGGWQHVLVPTLLAVLQGQLTTLDTHHQQQIAHYQQQISALERVLADQQILINHLHQEVAAAHARAEQQAAALRDLTERAAWLDQQASTLRHQLAAVQQGRLMRLLNALARRNAQ
ncbi:methyltransferase domain-containing protein [Kallotenue papyrolyticum]|uniref:methyltransferase domain-containing protein n=1 Tax=Kallotenue papyrolyticum TaxID=1325125 RepID=UPI0004785BD9|nr:class I SAM-dependent methyltransferase [Kallotenue papyrolyticum]